MGEWGKQRRDGGRRRVRDSSDRCGEWNPSRVPTELQVPRWEIDFCRAQCMPWAIFLVAKYLTSVYENVMTWDDSAGEDAFRNAKARYWAKLNGFESDIAVPDPYMYIDEVDQDQIGDPNLHDDIHTENESKGEEEGVIIWGDFFLSHDTGPIYDLVLPIIPTGWGNSSEKSSAPIIPTGWGDADIKLNVNADNLNGSQNDNMNWGNDGNANRNENYCNNFGNKNYGWNKKRFGNRNSNKGKQWRKNDNHIHNEDSRPPCAPVNGSTHYKARFDLHRTIT